MFVFVLNICDLNNILGFRLKRQRLVRYFLNFEAGKILILKSRLPGIMTFWHSFSQTVLFM